MVVCEKEDVDKHSTRAASLGGGTLSIQREFLAPTTRLELDLQWHNTKGTKGRRSNQLSTAREEKTNSGLFNSDQI